MRRVRCLQEQNGEFQKGWADKERRRRCGSLPMAIAHLCQQALPLNHSTYAFLLRWCRDDRALSLGRTIHDHIKACNREGNTFLANLLLQMYGTCGSIADALNVFNTISTRDAYSWNFMITAYAQNGQHTKALKLFRDMEIQDIKQDKCSFLSLLSTAATLENLEMGKKIHCQILHCGLDFDISLRNTLVHMYGKCGSPKEARAVFDRTCNKDVVSWTAMIAAYSRNSTCREALGIFRQMNLQGIKPNGITFVNALTACSSSEFLNIGKAIHKQIAASEFESDLAVRNALVSMYGKCGAVQDAEAVFNRTFQKNIVSWTAMITAYGQNGCEKEALDVFKKMELAGIKPNKVTFLSILDACLSLESLESGRAIHKQIAASGFESYVTVRNALVSMYGKCGALKDAEDVFNEACERDVISWTAMITAYAQNGCGNEALEVFKRMEIAGIKPNRATFVSILDACLSLESLENGRAIHQLISISDLQSDIAINNALLTMYGKFGSLKDAEAVFENMCERDVITWSAMIAAYLQNGHCKKALELFQQMLLKGIRASRGIFLSILDACGSITSLDNGKAIHEQIVLSGLESDVAIRTALVNMYGKCGTIIEARRVFDMIHERDLILWTAMIAAYAENGHSEEALELFRRLKVEGIKPDKITFLIILDAIASLASPEIGREIHDLVVASGLESDISVGTALVNMYGKSGALEDACLVFDKMTERDTFSYTAMVAAYAQNGYVSETLELFRKMELEGVTPTAITFLSILTACSHAGLLDLGWLYFISMLGEYGITPLEEHYVCMCDLLGRAGCLDEAENLIVNMAIQHSVTPWNALLGACRLYGDMERGTRVAEYSVELDPDNHSSYMLLSSIYAAAGRCNDSAKLRKVMKHEVLEKKLGIPDYGRI